jgi:hypothetical protein
MNKDGKQLSILVVGTSQEVVIRLTSELGIENYETDIRITRASAIEALKGQTHYDFILIRFGRKLCFLFHSPDGLSSAGPPKKAITPFPPRRIYPDTGGPPASHTEFISHTLRQLH